MSKYLSSPNQPFHESDSKLLTGFYEIKIQNEHKHTIEHDQFNSYKADRSYVTIPFKVNHSTSSSTTQSLDSSYDSDAALTADREFNISESQPIKVEYVPKGKKITVNVSIMW